MAEPAIQFGTSSIFGTQTGWVANNPSYSVVKERANALGPTGNEVASKLFDERTEATQEFIAASATTPPTIPANIGKKYGDYIVTSIAINTTSNGFVTMTLTGHKHANNDHDDNLQFAAHGIVLAKSFGAVDFFGGTPGDNADVESSSITIEVQHEDRVNADGEHLVGENYDGRISGTVTYHGVPDTAAGAGWDVTNLETSEENTGFLQTTVTAEKPIALSAGSPPPSP